MPTRKVTLTAELDRFVASKVDSGRYEKASDVVWAALRALEHQERLDEARIANLRASLEEGERSGVVKGNPFLHVRRGLRRSRR